jgi:hypothetical protein
MIEMLDVLRVGGQSDVFITEYPLYQLDCDLHESSKMIEMLDVLRVGGQSDVFITEYPLYQLDCDLHELDALLSTFAMT